MSQLSNEDLEEFRRLWREEFKEEVSLELARERATALIELYLLFVRLKSKQP